MELRAGDWTNWQAAQGGWISRPPQVGKRVRASSPSNRTEDWLSLAIYTALRVDSPSQLKERPKLQGWRLGRFPVCTGPARLLTDCASRRSTRKSQASYLFPGAMRSSSSMMLNSSVSVAFPVALRISSCCSGVSFSCTEPCLSGVAHLLSVRVRPNTST